jgi:hypothetical protein
MSVLTMQYQKQLIQRQFAAFLEKAFMTVSPGHAFLPNWHIDAIAAYLEACERGDIGRLIINMPPRMLKSITVSVAWPAWLLARQPHQRIMVASYAQSLSEKHSLDCRLIMQSPWYRRIFPATTIASGQNEKHKYVTTKRGHRMAVSVGGAATGEGGNILIVDDPLNPLQAMQQRARETANEWFRHTFVSRLDDKKKGAIIVVMQRLHEDDLTGTLLKAGGWEHLNLPAIAEEDSRIACGHFSHARKTGDVLHPAREDRELLARVREELGSAHFAAQYQQQPHHTDQALVPLEWFTRYHTETLV